MKNSRSLIILIPFLVGCGQFHLDSAEEQAQDTIPLQVLSEAEVFDLNEYRKDLQMPTPEKKDGPSAQDSEPESTKSSSPTPPEKVNLEFQVPKPSESSQKEKPSEPTKPPVEKEEAKPTQPTEPSSPKMKAYRGTGSVYFLPRLGDTRKCKAEDLVWMREPNGNQLVRLCKSEIAECAMQGSCLMVSGNERTLYSFNRNVRVQIRETQKIVEEPRFKVNQDLEDCPQGQGFRRICLDPNRSVAADMAFHKAGDVIYIPKVVGLKLPNGEIHDGYFIVRDIGGKILGEGRFDFFIGFDNFMTHPFTKIKLSDTKAGSFLYYKMDEARSEEVRKARAYPSAPPSVKKMALSQIEKSE